MSLKVPPSRFETLPARIIIYVLAFAGLGVIMTVRQSTKPSGLADFSVFYLGGQVARQGAWDDLYPIVIPGAVEHPGLPTASDPKPLYKSLAETAGLKDPFHYVYTPPSAILLIPLIYGSWESSIVGWWVLLGVCCCGSALVSGAMYARVAGRRDWLWAMVILTVAWCPLTWATIRSANSTAASSLMVSLTLYGLVSRKSTLTAVASYVGAALKFATIPLLLIPLVLARYRTVATCALVSIVLTLGSVVLTGVGPWREYVALLSTLGRPNPYPVNFSAVGLINHFVPVDHLTLALAAEQSALVLVLGVVVFGLFRKRHQDDAGVVLAGGSALLGWFLVFAPTTENHYFTYLFPLWGYYVAESRQSRLARLAALVIIGGTVLPFGGSSRDLPPLAQSHMIWAAGAALAFGIVRLYQRDARLVAATSDRVGTTDLREFVAH